VPGIEYVEADEVRRRPFRAALTPLPSLHSALMDTVGTGRKGTPTAWRAAIRAHLRAKDYETLAPLVSRSQTLVPDQLLGLVDPPGESLKDGIERMAATPEDELMAEIAQCRTASGNDAWELAERDPTRWLRRYITSLLHAWNGFAPIWSQAAAARDREVERIGVASALDAQLEFLDGLVAPAVVKGGRWCFQSKFSEGPMRLPETGLVLLPLVAGDGGYIVEAHAGTITRVCYPLRPVISVDGHDPPGAALEALLGVTRAEILRGLDRPVSIGGLAQGLQVVPSAATHHVGALEAAGLAARDRSGRWVMVRRTTRGARLMELYDSDSAAARRRTA
jgi:DNA-binding transcriptional ArsR family regulator